MARCDRGCAREERQTSYDDFQKLILEESPWIFLVASPDLMGHSEKLKGIGIFNQPHGPQLFPGVYLTK
jgi:ABC-type transport system substrate-binding protein